MSPKQYVLIIPDGAGDRARSNGSTPLAAARTPSLDFLARKGVSGRMQTLYDDLPKGSIVAQLGMLGWDPHRFFPHGRSSLEYLALDRPPLGLDDLAFRANLVRMDGGHLVSYNAGFILSHEAEPLVAGIETATRERFPGFELHHNSDFRNTLVIRRAAIDPRRLVCPEPHECEGEELDLDNLVRGLDGPSQKLARRIQSYLDAVREVLTGARANMLFPWSPSKALVLPSFAEMTRFTARAAIVGAMDFLHGIARAGDIEFFKVGNGRPDTDYGAKGRRVIDLLDEGCGLVVCHVNGPDEASHMGDWDLKIRCLDRIDAEIVRPVIEYFHRHPGRLGSVMVVPDHYTNVRMADQDGVRAGAHSIDPVPFVLWNGRERDGVSTFDEDAVLAGRHGRRPLSHLLLLHLLGVMGSRTEETGRAATPSRRLEVQG
jgi:2,3-bisphosphoglycerate-independent phosphoglycerate mutase